MKIDKNYKYIILKMINIKYNHMNKYECKYI